METALPLTRRQRQIMDFFEAYRLQHGISPTLDEIAQEFGVNKVTIFGHVAELERKGVLARAGKGISRGLQIVETTKPATTLRVLGDIAAGKPIDVVESVESIDLRDLLPAHRDVYGLRVRGDSMLGDSIRDGDIVIVERRTEALNGETVVAVLPGEETTLKRYFKEGDRVRLQPANPEMSAIYPPSVELRGVVIGVIRRY